jgi:hypothetical protein
VSLIVIMLAPTLIITYLRLRARSLTVFLEACGWAMNANIRLSGRLGRVFTHRPDLPYGAKRVSLGRLLVTWGVPAMLVLVAGYSIGVGVGRLLHLW